MLLHEGIDHEHRDRGDDNQRVLHHFLESFQTLFFRELFFCHNSLGHIDGVLQEDITQFQLQREFVAVGDVNQSTEVAVPVTDTIVKEQDGDDRTGKRKHSLAASISSEGILVVKNVRATIIL